MNRQEMTRIIEELTKTAIKEGLLEGLEQADIEYTVELANKTVSGELTSEQAMERLQEYAKDKGYEVSPSLGVPASEEDWDQIIDHGWIDVTEDVQMALREGGEPGIADGIMKVGIHPSGSLDGETPCVAIMGKPWFVMDNLRESERAKMLRAIALAADKAGVKWRS